MRHAIRISCATAVFEHGGRRDPAVAAQVVDLSVPVHASWLNQVEIYHSIIQRKLLAPNDFDSTAQLARALNDFERRYNEIAQPFDWTFTRDDLADLFARLDARQHETQLALAA